jgi:hypothetical protein
MNTLLEKPDSQRTRDGVCRACRVCGFTTIGHPPLREHSHVCEQPSTEPVLVVWSAVFEDELADPDPPGAVLPLVMPDAT